MRLRKQLIKERLPLSFDRDPKEGTYVFTWSSSVEHIGRD
jgi:hypothetical protein